MPAASSVDGLDLMKIGILSRNRSLYSTRRLIQAARLRGHEVMVIDTLSVAVEVGNGQGPIKTIVAQRPFAPHPVANLPPVEAIIPRIGASITEHGVAVVRYFESHGVTTTATAEAIASSRDKLRSLQLMAEAGLPVPKTAVVAQTSGIIPAVHAVGGPPVVLKTNQGTQGQGVILAEDLYTAEIGYRRLQRQGQAVLVQAFLAEADGVDRRVIVVGDRCVAAMQRRAAEGEFRANLHRGGTAIGMTITAEMRALALKAARLHGLLVAGVDMIRSQNGLSLLEVNSSPGLEGIEEATEVDIATRIIRALEKARPRRAGKRSRRRR